MAVNVETPFYKAKQQMAQWKHYADANKNLPQIDMGTPEAPNVLVDAVSVGGPTDGQQKPLVRHVLVKDLNKIGTRLKLEHPRNGVFDKRAPMGLFALFDGQSCAGVPGPFAAEFCARNFHTMFLERLARLPTDPPPDRSAIEKVLTASFEDLDTELITKHTDIKDGCGAAVVLLIADIVFTAVLGQCGVVLCHVQAKDSEGDVCVPKDLASGGGRLNVDTARLAAGGGAVVGVGATAMIKHPMGALSPVARTLGDRAWKPLLISTPMVQSYDLKGCEQHPFLFITSSSVATAVNMRELVDTGREFHLQPRVACGEIVMRALEARAGSAALAQCTAVEVCFLPPRLGGDEKRRGPAAAGSEPAAKKPRVAPAPGSATQSKRLRHILLKYCEGQPAVKDAEATGKKSRTRQEAEAVLRRAIKELKSEVKSLKKAPKDAKELVNVTSKKFVELCKELSDCETAKKGGTMCGDLGWVTPEELGKSGASFKDVVDVLLPGQLSDIAVSEQGLHLIQRIA